MFTLIGNLMRFPATRRDADIEAKALILEHGRGAWLVAVANARDLSLPYIDRLRRNFVEDRVRRFFDIPTN